MVGAIFEGVKTETLRQSPRINMATCGGLELVMVIGREQKKPRRRRDKKVEKCEK